MKFTFSPFTFKWVTVNPLFKFLFKEDTSSYRGKVTGILAARMFLFIDDKGKLTDIGNSYKYRLSIMLMPPF